MTFQGLYPPQKLKGAWRGESECGRKMFGKNLSVFAHALTLRSGTNERSSKGPREQRTFAGVCKRQEPIIIIIGQLHDPHRLL